MQLTDWENCTTLHNAWILILSLSAKMIPEVDQKHGVLLYRDSPFDVRVIPFVKLFYAFPHT